MNSDGALRFVKTLTSQKYVTWFQAQNVKFMPSRT